MSAASVRTSRRRDNLPTKTLRPGEVDVGRSLAADGKHSAKTKMTKEALKRRRQTSGKVIVLALEQRAKEESYFHRRKDPFSCVDFKDGSRGLQFPRKLPIEQ